MNLYLPPPAFTATIGAELVDWADTLDGLLGALDRTFEAALADTCEEVNHGLRDQLGLDRPARTGRKAAVEVLDHKADDAGAA
jgi:hypothetical protein